MLGPIATTTVIGAVLSTVERQYGKHVLRTPVRAAYGGDQLQTV